MIAMGSVVVILLDQDRLLAAGVTLNGGVRVQGWVSAQVPPDLEARDGRAVGAWVRGELARAKIGGSRAVFAAPRGDVVLKRLRLPPGVRGDDLPDMVRLQMARQLTVPTEGAAIDYVPMAAGEGASDVLAAAMPKDRLAFLHDVASAARLKMERVGLRASGVAALLAEASSKRNGPVLGVAPGAASVEFVVMDAGRLVFARSADLGLKELAGDDAAALPERIAVEAKRTWMSYRGGPESSPVDAVLVPGEGVLATEIARRCGEALEIGWELAGLPSRVALPTDMPETERLKVAPLAGLVGEEMLAEATLNFAGPRRAPDRAAARRQVALLAAFGAIVVVGTGIVLAKGRLRSLEGEAGAAHTKRLALAEEYGAFIKQEARLRHLEQWEKSGVDWVAHAAWLSDLMPDPRNARLDSLSGQLSRGNEVVFTPRDGQYAGGTWGVRHEAAITISGPTGQRETANDLRSRLVGSRVYRVDSKGADTPKRFSFELTTDQPVPVPPAPPEAEGGTP
ncbi:MAG: pilus assembly protein PilM [Phycisphaerales bacterium]|nr:pilus assembly protein PilM [Phycisphaerales bacterium]